jgi:hypothetical protein
MTRYAGRGGHSAARGKIRRGTNGRTRGMTASKDANKRKQLGIKIRNGPTQSIPVIKQPGGKLGGNKGKKLTDITEAWR